MPRSETDALAELLTSRGLTVACAESCTGGMIGASLTEAPGSSSYFLGSAVTYSNDSKERVLGVSHETLVAHGAVSAETAGEMVRGAMELYGSDTAIAVTGIAGPGGATAEKPVGLVYIAVADGPRVVVSRNVFEGGRAEVRSQTVSAAATLLRELLEGRL
ncbi:MAG: nicotinamide-nucleotide amidohydrolase family protein [Thermoplasmata archaeon]|nr:nicotinamide-nucleotide amidohydrolase family protein [Thermoplasmata archaeon]